MWQARARLTGVAFLALAIGILVYVADRAGALPDLIKSFAWKGAGPLFPVASQWLPSFVHPLAFALLSAAARASDAGPAYGACAAWWAVNVAFEAAQHPQVQLLRGTFDVGDIMAATLGALTAVAVIWRIDRSGGRHAC